MANDEPIVEFKVKDLFLKIDRKLDDISRDLHDKASRQDVEKIEARVEILERGSAAKAAVEDVLSLAKSTKLQWFGIIAAALVGVLGLVVDVLRH